MGSGLRNIGQPLTINKSDLAGLNEETRQAVSDPIRAVGNQVRISWRWKNTYPRANSRIVAAIMPVNCGQIKSRLRPTGSGAPRIAPSLSGFSCDPERTRTSNQLIKSQLLYH